MLFLFRTHRSIPYEEYVLQWGLSHDRTESTRGGSSPSSVLPEDDFDRLMRDLAKVLTEPDIGEWMTTPAMGMLSVVRHHPQYWGFSKATYRKWGGNPYDLEKAVDHYRTTHDLDALVETAPTPVDPFIFTDARTLQEQPSVPRRWLVQSLIANGLTILGGSPKSGKSYLAYALALAVATGGQLVPTLGG